MPSKTVTVGSAIGLHARPAAVISEAVVNSGAQVTLAIDDGEPVDAGSALISGNIFEDTPEAAIAGYRWNERATGDLTREAGDHAHLTIERNRTG